VKEEPQKKSGPVFYLRRYAASVGKMVGGESASQASLRGLHKTEPRVRYIKRAKIFVDHGTERKGGCPALREKAVDWGRKRVKLNNSG